MSTKRTWLLPFMAALLVIAVAVPALAAITRFVDVPDSNPFANDIKWIDDAGITAGCGPDTYCPNDPVTRAQMATFMNRLAVNRVVDAGTLGGLAPRDFVGPLGLYTVDSSASASTTGYYTADAWCAPGDLALSGGVQLHANSPDFVLIESIPTHVGNELPSGWSPTGWHGEVWMGIDLGGGFWSFRTWVVCANLTP